MGKDNLGDRMKGYENITRNYLTRRTPTILRIDGKAFHTFTKGLKQPYDEVLIEAMNETAKYLCENVQGCKMAYVQSDEISLLLTDYDEINTAAWFDKNILKMVSISASMATLAFNNSFMNILTNNRGNGKLFKDQTDYDVYIRKINKAMFDSRVFNIPKEEISNYFIWRQQDCTRNSIESVGRAYFSHKQLFKKNCNDIQEMLFQEYKVNWNDFKTSEKRGRCIIKKYYDKDGALRSKWIVDNEIPIFTQDRAYIECLV